MLGDGNSRNGYRERMLQVCAGKLSRARTGASRQQLLGEDSNECHRLVDRAVIDLMAGMCRTGDEPCARRRRCPTSWVSGGF